MAYLNYELIDGKGPSIKKIAKEHQVSRIFVRKIEGKLKNWKAPNPLVLPPLLPLLLLSSISSLQAFLQGHFVPSTDSRVLLLQFIFAKESSTKLFLLFASWDQHRQVHGSFLK